MRWSRRSSRTFSPSPMPRRRSCACWYGAWWKRCREGELDSGGMIGRHTVSALLADSRNLIGYNKPPRSGLTLEEIRMILSGKTPVKILLVDDQPANLLALEKILDGADYRLIRAKSGHEALERLEDDDFAVIVLDVQMPGLDGFATAKLIRARQRSRHTPIIFVSDHEAIEFPVGQEGAHEAVDYLVKPLVPAVLRARIKIFVDLFRLTRHVKKHLRAEESLKETNQRKDNFLAMLGHELRNALGPIRNAAQVLQQIGRASCRER